MSHRNSMHYLVRGYPLCRSGSEKEYCLLCDGIEADLLWLEEGIIKWYVRNFCFRERRSSARWVMHQPGVGNVFCEMLTSGELEKWDAYKAEHAQLFMGSDHRAELDVYRSAVCVIHPGPLSVGQEKSPSEVAESGACTETALAASVQAWRDGISTCRPACLCPSSADSS